MGLRNSPVRPVVVERVFRDVAFVPSDWHCRFRQGVTRPVNGFFEDLLRNLWDRSVPGYCLVAGSDVDETVCRNLQEFNRV